MQIPTDPAELASFLGVPTLDPGRQLLELPQPVIPYGSIPRTQAIPGSCIHCYISDAKFSRLFANPRRILATGCAACIEVNPSTGPGVPMAAALFGIYRKRAVSAIWQAHGIRIAVDLNVADEVLPFAFLGVPHGWRSYAVRKHRFHDVTWIARRYNLASAHAGREPVFIVVGGGAAIRTACRERGWLHVDEHCRILRRKDGGAWVRAEACEAKAAGEVAAGQSRLASGQLAASDQ